MAANYNCLLFDVDGTLLDFKAAEQEAIAGTLAHFGLPCEQEQVTLFSDINAQLWAALEKGEIKKDKLTVQRFSKLLAALDAKQDAVAMNNDFLTRLSTAAPIIPGANELLEELAEFSTLAAVSNGVKRVQINRLEKSGLLAYFDEVFVSEQLGVTKPNARFFEIALKQLGIKNKTRTLVIGDSLAADIKGGINAKLDTCWCNFNGQENTTTISPTYTVQDYQQLKLVAIGKEELERATTREKRHMV